MGYMNKHHSDTILAFAEKLSRMGDEARKKNAWSGGSFKILGARLVGIDLEQMELEVDVDEGRKGRRTEVVQVSLGTFIHNNRENHACIVLSRFPCIVSHGSKSVVFVCVSTFFIYSQCSY